MREKFPQKRSQGKHPSLRQRIHVIGVGSGAHLKRGDFSSTMHFESRRDIVPDLDRLLHSFSIDPWAPTTTLTPHPEAPWFDHTNMSPTYTIPVEDRMKFLLGRYGAETQ